MCLLSWAPKITSHIWKPSPPAFGLFQVLPLRLFGLETQYTIDISHPSQLSTLPTFYLTHLHTHPQSSSESTTWMPPAGNISAAVWNFCFGIYPCVLNSIAPCEVIQPPESHLVCSEACAMFWHLVCKLGPGLIRRFFWKIWADYGVCTGIWNQVRFMWLLVPFEKKKFSVSTTASLFLFLKHLLSLPTNPSCPGCIGLSSCTLLLYSSYRIPIILSCNRSALWVA